METRTRRDFLKTGAGGGAAASGLGFSHVARGQAKDTFGR